MSVPAEARVARPAVLLRRHRLALDVVAVAAIVALGAGHAMAGRGSAGSAIFSVALALPLLWRRRFPVAVFAALACIALVQWAFGVVAFGDVALLAGLYTVAATQPRRTTLAAAAVLELGVLLAAARWAAGGEAVRVFIGLSAMATAAGLLGTSTRNRQALLASLEERAARLELERDQQGRLAAAAERARIAREMHDIVAHNLTVMIALADGASYAVHDEPEHAESAMRTASRTGRQALTEMRRLLGVLGADRDPAALGERAPQPGLARLDDLLAQVRAAGLQVTYEAAGTPLTALPEGLQLAVFRIVQEALTNTLKHAGPDAGARLSVVHGPGRLVVEVSDTGQATGPVGTGGRGVRGMRERAAVYDGALDAGPAPDGGWRVRLDVPLAPVAAERAPA